MKATKVTAGSGNVFADIGCKNPKKKLAQSKIRLDLTRQLREAESQCSDLRKLTGERREEAKQLEAVNLRLNCMRPAIHDSLIREKVELEARLLLIDGRPRAIGLHPEQAKEVRA